jgi:hypothetical protein
MGLADLSDSDMSDMLNRAGWLRILPTVLAIVSVFSIAAAGASRDLIVYTAHQEWLSRIYVLDTNGTVLNYFQYDFYRWADVEIVDNELYLAEAFAPRVYKVDLRSGELDLVIDDWSLYYFYDLAYDGSFFYVEEWDYNRYYPDGTKDGTASYDGTVYGSAWDGEYLWTLGDEDLVRCWDNSNWPDLQEVTENNFTPPSAACRGLWFDGEHFWTAEAIDGSLGYIYKFDHSGQVVRQWLEPAFAGWAAGFIEADYLCGDCNGDGGVNIIDAVYTAAYVFANGPAPEPEAAGDVDCSGSISLADIVYLVGYIFRDGPPPCTDCY